ncbi:hypothetical protein O4H66_24655 [Comamonadaceae bacterium G21597-S1]|nr:hypothetical protein [Comamonadaceae bacterium G21597-S1]
MRHPPAAPCARDQLSCHFRSGDAMRSRSVSDIVLSGTVHIPAPPARLTADWDREIALQLALEPGDVAPMPLARARARWPHYRQCVQAMSDWLRARGLPDLLASSDVALMACRGAAYHHDAAQYGGFAFCNLFVSQDKGLDLHFPVTGQRIPLTLGTAVVFDTGQPHGVIPRGGEGFDASDFAPERDCSQLFLTWELPIEHPEVGHALRIRFDAPAPTGLRHGHGQLRLDDVPVDVHRDSGRWVHPGGEQNPSRAPGRRVMAGDP